METNMYRSVGIAICLCIVVPATAFASGDLFANKVGDVMLLGYSGFSFANYLTNVKGSNWSDPYNFSDLRMGDGIVLGGGVAYYPTPWLSLRLDGMYQPKGCGNCIRQQATQMVSVTTPPTAQMSMIKGWKGDAITVAPAVLFHTPALDLLGTRTHLYGGGGPTFTMSRLCDRFGCTDSNDWGVRAIVGVRVDVTERLGLFSELQHKEDYLDCDDVEGCFRGRRYGNLAVFGITYTF